MALGKIFIILGALLSILGTYVFALYGSTGFVGSGIGFILNTIGGGLVDPPLITGAGTYAPLLSTEIWIFYIILVIFLIFLAAGVLQLIGMKSRVVGLIFSLFPLGVGLMFIFLEYTDFLGIKSGFFGLFFIGEQYGDIFPVLLNLPDLGIGVYFLLAGGALGIIGSIMPRD